MGDNPKKRSKQHVLFLNLIESNGSRTDSTRRCCLLHLEPVGRNHTSEGQVRTIINETLIVHHWDQACDVRYLPVHLGR